MNCDEYYSYNALAGLVKAGEEEVVKYDPWELVSEAIKRMSQNGDVMRSDRLKQVMQEIDSSFDEKNLGISKFSRFCLEASQRGLISVNKLENGQLEVALPRETMPPIPGGEEPTPRPALVSADENGASEGRDENGRREERARDERGRRGRRGRGRGRDREDRGPRTDTPRAASASPEVGEESTATPPHGDKLVHPPAAAASADRAASAPETVGDGIGSGGERLTRQEAFSLVGRAVAALTSGDRAVPASRVRQQAFELLGRDSESLSERNFIRILKDAHDGDVIDLRRRGDDYDVAMAAQVAPVAEQLNRAAAAASPAPKPAGAPPVPRGMGPRGAGSRGRGPARRGSEPPPDLLLLGVVEEATRPHRQPRSPPRCPRRRAAMTRPRRLPSRSSSRARSRSGVAAGRRRRPRRPPESRRRRTRGLWPQHRQAPAMRRPPHRSRAGVARRRPRRRPRGKGKPLAGGTVAATIVLRSSHRAGRPRAARSGSRARLSGWCRVRSYCGNGGVPRAG